MAGKRWLRRMVAKDEMMVRSMVPMVMGRRRTRTLSQPKRAAAVTMRLMRVRGVMRGLTQGYATGRD